MPGDLKKRELNFDLENEKNSWGGGKKMHGLWAEVSGEPKGC